MFKLVIFLSTLGHVSWALDYSSALKIHQTAQSAFESQLQNLNLKDIELLINHEEPQNWGGAQVQGQFGIISIGADLLPDLSKEEFQFIYCHELGHFLGGEPRKKDSWASTEAQADYWAGAQCLRVFYPMISKAAYVEVVNQIAFAFFARIRKELGESVSSLSFYRQPLMDSPETMIFESEYSSFQCRYDIILAGARELPHPSCVGPKKSLHRH